MNAVARPSSENLRYLAVLVAGTEKPPNWLITYFRFWSPSLAIDRGVSVIQPTRATVFDAFKRMIGDIRSGNVSVQTVLDQATPELLDFLRFDERRKDLVARGLVVTLADLDAWVSEALSSGALADKNGQARRGRGRAMPAGELGAKHFCVLLIAQAWQYCRGSWPRPRSRKACEAAEILWRIAGGEAHSVGEEPHARWRLHLARSEKASDVLGLRAELRRYLRELERHQNISAQKN